MDTKSRITILTIVVLGLVIVVFAANNNGIGDDVTADKTDRADRGELPKGANATDLPLAVADGLSVSVFAQDLPGARVLVQDSLGNFWVSQTSRGVVSLLEVKDGKVISQSQIFKNLNRPHGLAFDPQNPFRLYVAETDKISYVNVYAEDTLHQIADLPSGDGHFTRTLGFGPDGRLYVSIGSSCNVCVEEDARRAKIFSMNRDGSDLREAVAGLRNAVFFTWRGGQMWATEMGRDLLGDNMPPDEVNMIETGKNYGWPYCYGNRIHDGDFDRDGSETAFCARTEPAKIEIQAHSAPLGLAFAPESWPEEYRGDLLVAYHGSWNRSVPTGYKIVRFELDEQDNVLKQEDFISGWFAASQEVLGRPVDIYFAADGVMYVTDDSRGVIYQIRSAIYQGVSL